MRLPLPLALLLLASPLSAQDAFVGAHGAQVPATYLGEDGAAADWQLDLWPGQAFHLLRDGVPAMGRWHATAGGIVLDLGEEELPLTVRNATRLVPEGGGDLVTGGTLTPATFSLPVEGMFTTFAGGPILVACATDMIYRVNDGGDITALRAAYAQARPQADAALFVTLDATVGPGDRGPALTVDRFGAAWPAEDCARAAARPPLEATLWRLITLGDETVDWRPPLNEPFLAVTDDGFAASAGCNRLTGRVTRDGQTLRFGAAATTRMACPAPLDDRERRLAEALGRVESFAIGGRTLRLAEASGVELATFEAVYLP